MSRPGARDERKDPADKSRAFSFRLHPDLPDEKQAIALIEKAVRRPGGLRRWIVELLVDREGLPPVAESLPPTTAERILGKLDKIMDRLRSGIVARSSTDAEPEASDNPALDDGFLSSLDRFLDVGMSAEPDEFDE